MTTFKMIAELLSVGAVEVPVVFGVYEFATTISALRTFENNLVLSAHDEDAEFIRKKIRSAIELLDSSREAALADRGTMR